MKTKWRELLSKAENPTTDLLVQTLKGGVDEHGPIDFIIAAEGVHQEFQVKRFGMKEVNQKALIDYLNGLKSSTPALMQVVLSPS